jgi:ribosomal-protein-alanine N-acetyltransferase
MARRSAKSTRPTPSPVPVLRTERLLLTLPAPTMAPEHLRFAEDNRAHLAPWEPPYPSDYFTLGYWRERLRKNLLDLNKDISVKFSIFWKGDADSPVLGHCNFNNLVWGAFHCATLGYRLDHRVQGKGVMHEALSAAIQYMFHERGFHRIQANYRPTNEKSGAVLRRLGFVVEGYARDYLFIDGDWRDHVLTSLTNPEMSGRPPRLPR